MGVFFIPKSQKGYVIMADIHVRKRGDKWYYSFECAPVDGKENELNG